MFSRALRPRKGERLAQPGLSPPFHRPVFWRAHVVECERNQRPGATGPPQGRLGAVAVLCGPYRLLLLLLPSWTSSFPSSLPFVLLVNAGYKVRREHTSPDEFCGWWRSPHLIEERARKGRIWAYVSLRCSARLASGCYLEDPIFADVHEVLVCTSHHAHRDSIHPVTRPCSRRMPRSQQPRSVQSFLCSTFVHLHP